jgi:hypothetical protein
VNRTSELASYLARADWTPQRLAHEINRTYGRWTISEKAPYGWLHGSFPRGKVPGMVAELLSHHLDETVAVTDVWPVGPGAVGPDGGSPYSETGFWRFVEQQFREDAGRCGSWQPVQAAVDWVLEPAAAAPTRARGRTLDPAAREVARAGADALWDLYWTRGRCPALDTVTQDLGRVATLLAECAYGRDEAADLLVTLCRLATLAGAVAWDRGDGERSVRFLVAALRASHLGGAHDLGAYVLSWLSYFLLWAGRHDDALRVAALASRGPGGSDGRALPPALHALLVAYRARAHALLGATGELHRVLDGIDPRGAGVREHDPAWCRWLVPGAIAGHVGRAWLDADRPDRAEAPLARGRDDFAGVRPRASALHALSLVQAHVRRGDAEAALAGLAASLEHPDRLDNHRARARLATIRVELLDAGVGAEHDAVTALGELTRTPA